MDLDLGAWARHIREVPAEQCGVLYVMFGQLQAIAAARLMLHRPAQKSLDSPPGAGRLLTLPEAASLLRVSEDTARAWSRSGQIPTVRIGRRVRVPSDALEALLHGRKDHHT